jgi:hypothetical protein
MAIPKTIEHKLAELEDHLFLVIGALNGLNAGEGAHLRHLAAELRTLICLSSGTEGLLWRLVDELGVIDDVALHRVGKVNPDLPLARGLRYFLLPLALPGCGDPRLPVQTYSLRALIKTGEAVFVAARSVTHEQLIKWLSQQMGSAHEDDAISPILAELNGILIANVQAFFFIIQFDAELTIDIGERVLQRAVTDQKYVRKRPSFANLGTGSHRASCGVTSPLSSPTLAPINGDQGSFVFLLRPNEHEWKQSGVICKFPAHKSGTKAFEASKTAEGFFELRVTGLFVSEYTFRGPVPVVDDKGLMVVITWGWPEIRVYLNGAHAHTIVASGEAGGPRTRSRGGR